MLKALGSIPTVCASSTQELELWNGKSRDVSTEDWACWHTHLVPVLNRQVEINLFKANQCYTVRSFLKRPKQNEQNP